MPRKTKPKKTIYTILEFQEDRRGTKCSLCGQIFTMPKGYSYPEYAETSYENVDHPSNEICIKYLRKELEETKSELQELRDRIRVLEDLELRSRSYNEYH